MKLHTTSLNLLSGTTLVALCLAANAATPTAKISGSKMATPKMATKMSTKKHAMKHTKMSHKTKALVVPTTSKMKMGNKMSAKPAVKG